MQDQTVPQTSVDLSDEGVESILAALTNAGIEVHYNETDGDCYIDIWLTDFDAAPIDILSWRDSRGWWLAEWDSNDTNGSPDREWTVFGATPADVARDVAAILGATPSEAPDAIVIDPVAGAELAAKVQAEVAEQQRPLLADPEQVALVRDLIRHARKAGAEHATYAIGPNIDGKGYGSQEHVWTLGVARVSYHEGALAYQRRNVTILSGAGFDKARDVADLLAAVGVIPQSFASAYRSGWLTGYAEAVTR